MLRADPREAELGACLLLRSRTSAQATGRTPLPPRREVRPQRLGNLARTLSRAPLPDRCLRLGAGESVVGFTPQDPKSERALRFRGRLCGEGHGCPGRGRTAATGQETQRTESPVVVVERSRSPGP